MSTNALRALDPLEFRFTDPLDVERYGSGWYVYDESYWLRKRARDLIELEGELGTSLTAVMNGMRSSTTLGDTAAAWLSIKKVNPQLAGEFDDFNPITNLIEWRAQEKAPAAEAAPMDPAPAPELPGMPPRPDPDLPMAGPWRNTISAPMDTVTLPNLPAAE